MPEPAPSTPAIRATALEVLDPEGKSVLCGPLDLEVAPGEHVLCVGPSGSGKTSLLRAVAGLARKTRGTVALFGEVVTADGKQRVAPEQRGIGYLFQGGALWPHMSVEKTLAFTLAGDKALSADQRKARAAELVERVGLAGKETRRPSELSGGEGQRLALARALALRPRLLLLDEPLGPLDAPLRASMLALIHESAETDGLTILHVTHDPGEAQRLATRTLTFDAGQLRTNEVHP